MACCLMAPSHDLNQHWLVTNGVLHHSPKDNSTGNAHQRNHYNTLQNDTSQNQSHIPSGQSLKLFCFPLTSYRLIPQCPWSSVSLVTSSKSAGWGRINMVDSIYGRFYQRQWGIQPLVVEPTVTPIHGCFPMLPGYLVPQIAVGRQGPDAWSLGRTCDP